MHQILVDHWHSQIPAYILTHLLQWFPTFLRLTAEYEPERVVLCCFFMCRWRASVIERDIVRAMDWLICSRAACELYPFNEHEAWFVAGLKSIEATVGGKPTFSSKKVFLPASFSTVTLERNQCSVNEWDGHQNENYKCFRKLSQTFSKLHYSCSGCIST